jgi:hypothetical protein
MTPTREETVMLRLRLDCGGDPEWLDVARRLRGASLDLAEPADFDAIVLLVAGEGSVERHLAAGKHVLLANEFYLSEDGLAAWSARSGGPLLAVLNRDRFLPSRQLVCGQLDRLGEPGLVRLRRWSAVVLPPHLLRDLDSVIDLIGRSLEVVWASGAIGDLLQVHLGFHGGAMALIDHAAGRAVGDHSSLSVIASSGAAYADDHANQQLLFTPSGAARALRGSEDVLASAAMVQSFVDSVAAGADLSADLTAWRRVLGVYRAVKNSLAWGRAVKVEGL